MDIEKICGNSRGQLKKKWNFQDGSRKYHVEFPYSKSSFLALEFPRGVTQFQGICKGKAFFCPEIPRVK